MSPESTGTAELNELLEFLKHERGFDFTGYKKTTLRRRIEKRLHAVHVAGYAEYQDHVEANPREFTELFNTILINVTSFFRDPPAWDFLAEEIVPRLLEGIGDSGPIRVWSAGCASGEEAYTIAMVLAEAMGMDAFRSRVKIYATDVDEDALAEARQAVYPDDALKAVPEGLVEKYFEPNSRGMAFRADLRRSVIFGRNDLVTDAPISRIDLLLCRNVLMYFMPEAQQRILEHFNFALTKRGCLFMGKSEMLVTHSDLFAPDSVKWRMFTKVPRAQLRDRLASVLDPGDAEVAAIGIRGAAAAMSPVAQIVVDRAGFLKDANTRASELFSLGPADVGRPFQDLSLSYRPADLRSGIESAYKGGGTVHVGRVEHASHDGRDMVLDIDVAPVLGRGGEPLGATVLFNDVTELARLATDYAESKRELEAAYEELQSTVEELETTNEELQSTNEELETMNEELQSTNDELETMNNEVNTRATELDRVNLFLEGILGSLGMGVAVIDRERTVQVWNAMSHDLWGLRADEVEGQNFLELDMGLPVSKLKGDLTRILSGDAQWVEKRLSARDRRGRDFDCTVRMRQLALRSGEVYGAMILTGRTEAALELREAEAQAAAD